MFGHHRANRAKKKAKKQQASFEKEKMDLANNPQKQKEADDLKNQQLSQKTEQNKSDRASAREEGKKYAEDVLGRDVEGLSPEKRQAMQYEANKGIQRNMQSANRKLLGDQATHGVLGKGGVGYAQQKDLQKIGTDAQGQVHRDLDKLNSDLAMKKLAAMFNIEQGEASQAQLDKQLALDELNYAEEQKKNKRFEDQMNNYWNRL